jgi:hypothetical protein
MRPVRLAAPLVGAKTNRVQGIAIPRLAFCE